MLSRSSLIQSPLGVSSSSPWADCLLPRQSRRTPCCYEEKDDGVSAGQAAIRGEHSVALVAECLAGALLTLGAWRCHKVA